MKKLPKRIKEKFFEDVKEFLDQTIDGVPPLPSEERVIIDPIWREKYSGKEIK